MINIRSGAFETNSSSVHALCISNDKHLIIPYHVVLRGGDFGWNDEEVWCNMDYLYQACLDVGKEQLLFDFLDKHNISWERYSDDNIGYVDHADALDLTDLFSDENRLLRFLFGGKSFVKLGNDNYTTYDEFEKWEHRLSDDLEVVWKGN
jgi:hypothetical protein